MPGTPETACDVVVIGGGPAGSTTAAFLAARGHDVVVLEKDRHPRFHIGESLLPKSVPIFERLGVLDEVDRIGVRKLGAEFHAEIPRPIGHTYWFRSALDPRMRRSYQVPRAALDELLLRNAEAKGARVHECTRALDVSRPEPGVSRVRAVGPDGEACAWRARWVVDASGRDTLVGSAEKLKRRHPRHSSAAVYGHFRGVPRQHGVREGNIAIFWFDGGWIWQIPLPDGRTSLGAVGDPMAFQNREGSREDLLWRLLRRGPKLFRERLETAELVSEATVTGNYSYGCTKTWGDGWLLVGDAFAFVDPVFSSGVHLALDGGEQAAGVVDAILRGEADTTARLEGYDRRLRKGLDTFSWFIERFNGPAFQRLFLEPANPFGIQDAVTSVLAGDVYGNRSVEIRLLGFRALHALTSLVWMRAARRERLERRSRARTTFAEPSPDC